MLTGIAVFAVGRLVAPGDALLSTEDLRLIRTGLRRALHILVPARRETVSDGAAA
jgi:hypothetical protein